MAGDIRKVVKVLGEEKEARDGRKLGYEEAARTKMGRAVEREKGEAEKRTE